jgi:hypothetical protein
MKNTAEMENIIAVEELKRSLILLFFRMFFLFIFRRIGSERIFPHHAFNSLFVTGEFTVGKDADDYYDNKNDDKVFHLVWMISNMLLFSS